MLGIVPPVDLTYWNDIRLAQLQQISYVCCDGLKVDDCMQHVVDLVSTPTGEALFDQVEKLAEKANASIKIQFSKKRQTKSRRLDESTLLVNINLDEIKTQRYPYLVRRDLLGEDLDFVSVYHPPSVVLGHELGHVRHYLESGMPDDDHIDQAYEADYKNLMRPVEAVFYGLLKVIAPAFTLEEKMTRESVEKLLANLNSLLASEESCAKQLKDEMVLAPEKASEYQIVQGEVNDLHSDIDNLTDYLRIFYPTGPDVKTEASPEMYDCWNYYKIMAKSRYRGIRAATVPQIRELFDIFTNCVVTPWNSGRYNEVLNILPVQRSGYDMSNPTVSDGIFLREILEGVGMTLGKGDDRCPAFFEMPPPDLKRGAQDVPKASLMDLSKSEDRIWDAFRASTGPWLRWSHMSVSDWNYMPGQMLKENGRISATKKNWRDQCITALYTQPGIEVDMRSLPAWPPPLNGHYEVQPGGR